MGLWRFRAVVQDSVHGIIPVNEAEYWLLQTPFLRRLHEVKQLGLSYLVFPSATHSRLEHSLGVMHLASRMAYRVVEASRRNSKICSALFHACSDDVYSAFIQVARLTGLLHDVGHPPFSHMLEDSIRDIVFNPRERGVEDEGILEGLEEARKVIVESGGFVKIHDVYTRHFIERISELSEGSDYEDLNILVRLALESVKPGFSGLRDGDLEDLGVRVEACRLVNYMLSGSVVDIDRLDYLVRDAKYTGVVYGYIDIDRVLEGLDVVEGEGGVTIVAPPKAYQPIEDVFDARFKMYKTVYYHHKLSSLQLALDMAFARIVGEWWSLQPGIYSGVIEGPWELLNPRRLSEIVKEARVYFDDPEVMSLVKTMRMKGSKTAVRWAKALLEARPLLPISLVKRMDELVSEIVKGGEWRAEHVGKVLDNIIHDDETFKGIVERSIKTRGVDRSAVKVERVPRRIVGEVTGALKELVERSVYLRTLIEAASIPVTLVYAYSDDEETHMKLYRERDRIRKLFTQELVREAIGRLKS
ncbi:MAG: HD domain-containing protein [Thermoprotei archaeon]|nr:HD domain-containing protein [Thermoprotei archaeon]